MFAENCDVICWIEIIFFIILIVSLVVYVGCLVVILKDVKTDFNDSFWLLCLSVGVADLSKALHLQWAIKLPSKGTPLNDWFAAGGGTLAAFSLVVDHYLVHCQIIGVLLITVNRYSAIVFARNHKQLWTLRTLLSSIVLQWLLPVLFVAPIIALNYRWARPPNSSALYAVLPNANDRTLFHHYLFINMCWSGVRVPFYVFSYGHMFYVVLKHFYKQRNPAMVTVNVKLALVGLVLVLLDLCVFATVLTITQTRPTAKTQRILSFKLQVLSETFSGVNGWLLLATSTQPGSALSVRSAKFKSAITYFTRALNALQSPNQYRKL